MSDYIKVPTSAEVWAVIKARHGNSLAVFESFSNPDGSFMGNCRPEMMTVYGFHDSAFPLMGARTTWETQTDGKRGNERTEYWLCIVDRERAERILG